jgi:hypothetical protein
MCKLSFSAKLFFKAVAGELRPSMLAPPSHFALAAGRLTEVAESEASAPWREHAPGESQARC